MAEVTGNIGAEYVELDNAATEATLQELLEATLLVSKRYGASRNKKLEIDNQIKGMFNNMAKMNKSELAQRQLARNQDAILQRQRKQTADENKKITEDEAAEAKKKHDVWDKTNKIAFSVVKYMAETVDQMAGAGDSLTSMTSMFSKIPIIGETLSTTLGPVASAAERTQSVFVKTASAGATFNGSITEMVNSAGQAGLTLEAFAGIIANNSAGLALLGEGTQAGAIRFSKLSKEMKTTITSSGLADLGYTTETANEAMAQWIGQLAKTGNARGMSDAQLIASTATYLKELDAVSKLTGESKEAMQAEADARMNDSRWRATLAKADEKTQKEMNILMSAIPKEMRAGAQEILTTGVAQSDAAKQFVTMMQASGQDLTKMFSHIRNGGELTADMTNSIIATMQADSKKLTGGALGDTLATYLQGEYNDLMVGAYNMGQQQLDLEEARAKTGKVIDENTDKTASQIVGLKQTVAALSAQANNLLLQFMPQLQAAVHVAGNALSGAMDVMSKNIGLIDKAVKLLLVSQLGLAVMQAASGLTKLGAKMTAWGSTPAPGTPGGRGRPPGPGTPRPGGAAARAGGAAMKGLGNLLKVASLGAIIATGASIVFPLIDDYLTDRKDEGLRASTDQELADQLAAAIETQNMYAQDEIASIDAAETEKQIRAILAERGLAGVEKEEKLGWAKSFITQRDTEIVVELEKIDPSGSVEEQTEVLQEQADAAAAQRAEQTAAVKAASDLQNAQWMELQKQLGANSVSTVSGTPADKAAVETKFKDQNAALAKKYEDDAKKLLEVEKAKTEVTATPEKPGKTPSTEPTMDQNNTFIESRDVNTQLAQVVAALHRSNELSDKLLRVTKNLGDVV